MGDNTSAIGWVRRSNFREKDKEDIEWMAKQKVDRKLANLILDSGTCLYSQWFVGNINIGAYSLSRDCQFLTPVAHENFLKHFAKNQVPKNLKIKPLPNEITCFVGSILRKLPVRAQRLRKPKPSEMLIGVSGSRSLSLSDCSNLFS